MIQQSWTLYFKNKINQIEEAYRKQPSRDLSLLGYAIKNKFITTQEYLTWAQKSFDLPIVTHSFFQEHPNSYTDWNNWKNLYAWNLEIQPLASWDGHLLVGCLEIPNNFPIELKPIFLLCDFNDLENSWKLKSNPNSQTKKPQDFSKQSLKIQVLNESNNNSNHDDILLSDETPEIPDANEPQEPLEMPVGLPDDLAPFVEAKTEITIDPVPIAVAKTEQTQTHATAQVIKSELSQVTKTQQVTTTSGSTAQKADNAKYILNALFDKNSNQFRDKANALFKKLNTHFEKSMILTLDAEELNLHPYMWDNHFVQMTDTNSNISLSTPSVFNIVQNTQKPFHGPIVVNDINEKYFDNWNQGTLPAHITIIPLIINSKAAGMILSIGEKSCYNFGVLKFAENSVADFANELATIIESTAA